MDCTWNNPGLDPFRGHSIAQAVARYELPPSVANDLSFRIKAGHSDAVVYVKRDTVFAPFGTASGLRDMHFGPRMCTGPVSRNAWPEDRELPALVYCSIGYCLAVPVICGNISRIDYTPRKKEFRLEVPAARVNQVPEPSVLHLLGVALIALLLQRHRRRAEGRTPCTCGRWWKRPNDRAKRLP